MVENDINAGSSHYIIGPFQNKSYETVVCCVEIEWQFVCSIVTGPLGGCEVKLHQPSAEVTARAGFDLAQQKRSSGDHEAEGH